MRRETSNVVDLSQQRREALSRWDNEGGAGPGRAQERSSSGGTHPAVPELNNSELVHLRVRVIALENVLIALLAQASDQQLELIREMADYIAPRPGFTQHPLTIDAADHMTQLVERAGHFRMTPPA